MLPLQFFGQNVHFAISLLAALVFFAISWLYFDAWISKKSKSAKDIPKWAGFLLVSFSFLIYATIIEQTGVGRSALGNTSETIATILRLLGYAGIVIGQLVDPLVDKPKTKGIEEEFKATPALAASPSAFGALYGLPLATATIAILYWRRATTGLERHLKPVVLGFGLMFGFELLSLSELWQGTANPNLFNLVRAYGPLWLITQLLLLSAVIVLGRWVWRYLTERFVSQLFMIFTSAVLGIFLITTVSFTFLLTHSVQNDSLNNLSTASKVLNYAITSKKAQATASAEAISQNPAIISAVESKNHKTLANLTGNFLASKQLSGLAITSSSAQVLLRAESPDKWGDSISSDSLVRRALVGETSSTITTADGVLGPVLSIKSTVPIIDGGAVVGTVSTSLAADNSFVDGIKNSTGLDSSIYSGDVLSATTLVSPDGKTRPIGIKQTSSSINRVLSNGTTYEGTASIFNRQFLAVYTPLKDSNNNVVGILFIGQPSSSVLDSAAHSIDLTFIVAVLLMIISTIPAYLIARSLSRQLE